ncbi:MAG: oligosaccharide flippase family protein [Bacteroidota bacterium]
MNAPPRFVARWLDRLGVHTRDLVGGAAVAFTAKVLGAGAGFALSYTVARVFGPDGTGEFYLALGALSVVTVLGRLGVDQSVVRFVAAEASERAWGRVRSLAWRSLGVAIGPLLLGGLGLAFGADLLAEDVFGKPDLAPSLRAVAWGVVPLGLAWVYVGLLRGRRDIAASQLVQVVLNQVLTLLLLGVLYVAGRATVPHALHAYALATAGGLLVGALWWHTRLPPGDASVFPVRLLATTSLPLHGIAIMGVLTNWLPVLLLGALATSAETGILAIAVRVITLAGFVLMAINVMAAPQFAALVHQRQAVELARLVRRTSMLTTVLAIPLLIALLAVPHLILGLFGEAFLEGTAVLRVLAVGYVINLVTGSVGTLLVMSGHERSMQTFTVISTALLAVGCVVLIPALGGLGAALATSAAMALQNILAAWWVWRTFRINPLFFLPTPRPRLD